MVFQGCMRENQKTLPQKILFVENGIGYGGAVVCLRRLILGLDRGRFTPILVTTRAGKEYQGIGEEVEWHHLPDKLLDLTGLERWVQSMEERGAPRSVKFAFRQAVARCDDLFNFLPFFLRLLWQAVKQRPAMLHANNEPLCNRAAILVGKALGVPVICHVRGEIQGSRLVSWLVKVPVHFVLVSKWLAKDAERIGIPRQKRTVVYDGIGFQNLNLMADGNAFRHRHGIPGEAFAVGLVGLLISWKGQELFIEAARELASTIPGLKMVIVGGTPDRCQEFEKQLKDQVVGCGLEKTVIFTGHEENMCEVYRGLDVVVSASLSPEPLGMVVFEAMAMERPVVAPAHGGAAELCRDGETAILFRPGNASSLAEAILTLYQNPDKREEIRRVARNDVLDIFDLDRHVERIQALYERFLPKNHNDRSDNKPRARNGEHLSNGN